MQQLRKWLKNSITRPRTVEGLSAVAALAIVIAIVTVMTPYQPPRQSYSFYEADAASNDLILYRADVTRISDTSLTAVLLDGPVKDKEVTVPYENMEAFQRVDIGSRVIISENEQASFFYSVFRLPFLIVLLAGIPGALFSVPIVAVLNVMISSLVRKPIAEVPAKTT